MALGKKDTGGAAEIRGDLDEGRKLRMKGSLGRMNRADLGGSLNDNDSKQRRAAKQQVSKSAKLHPLAQTTFAEVWGRSRDPEADPLPQQW